MSAVAVLNRSETSEKLNPVLKTMKRAGRAIIFRTEAKTTGFKVMSGYGESCHEQRDARSSLADQSE